MPDLSSFTLGTSSIALGDFIIGYEAAAGSGSERRWTADDLTTGLLALAGATPAEVALLSGATSNIQAQINAASGGLSTHEARTDNPHTVTATQVGLGNVDNTSDADKPVSTLTQAILDGKAPLTTVSDTAPVSPTEGDLWFNSASGKLYAYYADVDSSQWISASNVVNADAPDYLDKLIVVNQDNVATTLGGTIDSTKVYFIDGIIDLGTTQVTVPTTGMTIKGHSFDISKLTSSEDNYTMFVSESIAIGSGNLLGADYAVEVTGAGSKVYELYDATGFNAFEFVRINYNDCTSLGDLYDYRQGLEDGTGRFGGSPSLTLHGLWRGGYRITTSIVRSLAGTGTAPLFKEGTLFQMNSRFLTDINCDLPSLAPFCDFAPANFPNPSTVQLKGAIFSRDGAFDATDTNIFPNLNPGDLQCDWDNNVGVGNTFIGGRINCDAEAATSIATAGEAVDLNGTFGAVDLQHFDSPASGRLRHTGINPKEFTVNFDFVIDAGNNEEVEVFLIKIDALASVTVEYAQLRVINNLQGGRNVSYFTGQVPVTLSQNDLLFWQVANVNNTTNVTLEQDSAWSVSER